MNFHRNQLVEKGREIRNLSFHEGNSTNLTIQINPILFLLKSFQIVKPVIKALN